VVIEGDNESLFKSVCKKDMKNRSYLGSIVKEIQTHHSQFTTCNFHFIPRMSNKIAHKLAHLALSDPNRVWIEEVPEVISNLYFHELLS